MNEKLSEFLSQFVSDRRNELIFKILDQRTRYITVVLEDIFQPHNASAVIRTCECLGIQDIHIIENKNEFNVNPDVVMGSSKWINIKQYKDKESNTLDTIKELKMQGYRIVATTPHTDDVELDDFDLYKGKSALFFGTELKGLSKLMIENADEYIRIPMAGFTESFNISVSAAIILHHLTQKLKKTEIAWKLSNEEKIDIRLDWLRKSIKKPDLIEKVFLKNITL